MTVRNININIADAEVIHVALSYWLDSCEEWTDDDEFTFEELQFAIGHHTLKKIHAFLMKELPSEERSKYDYPY